jgi:hypothetical protein
MKPKLSLEQVDLISIDETALQEAEAQAQTTLDAADQGQISPEETQSELIYPSANIQQLEKEVRQVDVLGAVADALEGYSPTHPNFAATGALQKALQGFTRLNGSAVAAPQMVAQESLVGYPTQDQLRVVAQENLQSIKDSLRAVLRKITEIITRIIAWFKRLFNRQQWRAQNLKARTEKAEEAAKETKALAQALHKPLNDHVIDEKIFNDKINRVLSVHGQLISPSELVRGIRIHVEQMRQLIMNFSRLEDQLLPLVEEAFHAVYGHNNRFEDLTAKIFELIYRSNVGEDRGVSAAHGEGVHLYETPLYFGGHSYFRTIQADAAALLRDGHMTGFHRVQAYVGRSWKLSEHNDHSGEAIFSLSFDVCERVDEVIAGYLKDRERLSAARAARLNKLSRLQHEMAILSNSVFQQHEQMLRRSRLLLVAMGSILALMNASHTALVSYDDGVLDAAMTYIERSYSVIRKQLEKKHEEQTA